jgi:hypothetical protein
MLPLWLNLKLEARELAPKFTERWVLYFLYTNKNLDQNLF